MYKSRKFTVLLLLEFVSMLSYIFFYFFIQGLLNISSSETSDILAIQNFVKDYVNEYVGMYNFDMLWFIYRCFLHAR